jgi:hypothetical protein
MLALREGAASMGAVVAITRLDIMALDLRAAAGEEKDGSAARRMLAHGETKVELMERQMWSMWRLFFCIVAFLFISSETFAQQSTPMDYAAAIRSVSSLNADGLDTKSSREENCKPLPSEMVSQCRSHMETIGDSRRRMEQAINAVEEAAKKGSVDRKILQRLDAQINAYISLRNFVFLWLEDK